VTDFSAGAVLGRSVRTWGRNAAPFTLVVLAIQSPTIVLAGVWNAAADGHAAEPSRAIGILSTLLSAVVCGALTTGTLRSLRGGQPRPGQMIAVGFRLMWNVLSVTVVLEIAVLLGFVLLVVPGLALVAGLWVAVPVAATERWSGTSDALSRSWELTKGRRWKVLAVALSTLAAAVGALAAALTALEVAEQLGASSPAIAALEHASFMLAVAFVSVASTVSYRDLCVAREGIEEADLAAVFE